MLAVLALVCLTLGAGVGCSTNPATGRAQLNMLSEAEEVSIGEQAAPEFLAGNGGEIPDEQIRAYVSAMGHEMAAISERPDLPWEFFVIDSAQINAFALPGGKVFMSRGLMQEMTNDAQLAGVLGHEIGHVTAQHIGQQMSQRMVVSGLLIGLGVAAQTSDEDWVKILGVGAGAGGTLYLLSYGRDQESESDELGVRYMSAVGYNPVGQLQVMQILAKASEGADLPPEILSTHPLPETRIRRLEKHLDERYPDHRQTGRYKLGVESFQTNVLDRLNKLPPPKHGTARSARIELTPEQIAQAQVVEVGEGLYGVWVPEAEAAEKDG